MATRTIRLRDLSSALSQRLSSHFKDRPRETTPADTVAARKRRAVKFAEWRLGRVMRHGAIIGLPAGKYFSFLQELSLTRKYSAHEVVTIPGLAHFAIVSDSAASNLFAVLLSYIEGARRLNGLEGIFLSGMIHAQTVGNRALFARGAYVWKEFDKASSEEIPRAGYLTFFDREHSVLSTMRAETAGRLYAALRTDAFRSQSLTNLVQTLGSDQSGVPLNLPGDGDAAMDRDHCKDLVNSLVQVGGVVVGLVAGGGAYTTGSNTDASLGRLALGFGVPVGVGAALGPIISTFACKDSASAVNDAVNGLVAAVQSGAITVDQALAAAAKLGAGSEPTAPASDGRSLDQVLADSPDQYSDVSAEDIANDLSAPTSDASGKPDSIDQATWNLVNSLTDSPNSSDSAPTAAPNDTSAPSTDSPSSDPADPTPSDDSPTAEDTPTPDDGPSPSPSGMPTPDGDGGGGNGGFPVGVIGPWVAGFEPDGGGDGNPSPKGDTGMPTPDNGGPGGPVALPSGSILIPASGAFGAGLINTAGLVQAVVSEGASKDIASCSISGIPRFNADGSIGTVGFMGQRGISSL